jgi:hypothetical protein
MQALSSWHGETPEEPGKPSLPILSFCARENILPEGGRRLWFSSSLVAKNMSHAWYTMHPRTLAKICDSGLVEPRGKPRSRRLCVEHVPPGTFSCLTEGR